MYPKLRDHYWPQENKDVPHDKQLTGVSSTPGSSPRKYKPFRASAVKAKKNSAHTIPSISPSSPSISTTPFDDSRSKQGSVSGLPASGDGRRGTQDNNRRYTNDKRTFQEEKRGDIGTVKEEKDERKEKGSGLKKILALDQLHNYMGPEERLRKLEEVKTELTSILNTIEGQLQAELMRQREVGPEPSPGENQGLLLPPESHPSHVATIQITELPSPNQSETQT